MNRDMILRRAAPLAAVLAGGAGLGAGVYAATSGGSAGSATTTVVASVPARQIAVTTTGWTQLYKAAAPGVVDITVSQGGGGGAQGSGFVIDQDGHVITNEHVVDGATSVRVRFQNGKTAPATVVGTDKSTDIAVIKVNADKSLLHPLPLGNSSSLQVGQEVAAIGSPFGLPGTITTGIVSAVGRTITAPNRYSISNAIQTDAAINHGNSGGPLLDASGDVIGVNAQIESDSGGNDGVGFAIPINAAKSVATTIAAGGTVRHAYLGIRIGDSPTGEGAVVSTVVGGSPASRAGIRAGDVVTAVDGAPITSADELTGKLSTRKPGDKVTLTIRRGGGTEKVTATLGTRPS